MSAWLPPKAFNRMYFPRFGSIANVLSAKVKVAELMGREYIIYFDLGGKKAVPRIDASKPVSAGDELKIKVDLLKARLYDPVSELAIN